MKKRNLTLALLLAISISSFAAPRDGANPYVSAAFKTEFKNAEIISWDIQKNFTRATFKINNEVMFAYFESNGALLAVSRNILSSQLPINLMTSLNKNYADSWITDLFEIDVDGETDYYVTLENSDNTLILKSDDGNNWQVYKKQKKDID